MSHFLCEITNETNFLFAHLLFTQVSSDLSIVDLDVPFNFIFTFGSTSNCYSSLIVLGVITWQVLFVSIPMIFLAIRLQVIVIKFIDKKNVQ